MLEPEVDESLDPGNLRVQSPQVREPVAGRLLDEQLGMIAVLHAVIGQPRLGVEADLVALAERPAGKPSAGRIFLSIP